MNTISITLPPYLTQWVEDRVASGRYSDVSDVIREAVRLLEQREQEHAARVREMIGVQETAQQRPQECLDANGRQAPGHGTLGALLDTDISWVGDDLEECLALVYQTRSPVEF